MTSGIDSLESILAEITNARKRVAKSKSKQITQGETLDNLNSVARAWFSSHRPVLYAAYDPGTITPVDEPLGKVLDATTKASARTTYVKSLDDAKAAIKTLRRIALTAPTKATATSDAAPDFSPLASDATMQSILTRRWDECQRCARAGAHLAATVMMGGLLEALFVARANQLANKGPLFRAKAAPKDRKTGKPLQLPEWMLSPYIDVAAELGWITPSGKGVAGILRDYRNYIHPEKERSHGIAITEHDTSMFWDITKGLARQLLALQGKN